MRNCILKTAKPFFVNLPEDFRVEDYSGGEVKYVYPTGVHMTYNNRKVFVQYAGESASDTSFGIELPSDPKVLRKLTREINKIAKELENR